MLSGIPLFSQPRPYQLLIMSITLMVIDCHARRAGNTRKKSTRGSLFLKLGDLGLDALDLLVLGELASLVLEGFLLPLLLGLLLTSIVDLLEGVLTNLLVCLLVQLWATELAHIQRSR